jgi:hypothetical protein
VARSKLKQLLKKLDIEIKKAEKRASETQRSASEIARSAANSPSQSGDRTHAEGQALITAQSLQKLEDLKSEVKESVNKPAQNIVQSPCFLEVIYDDGLTDSFYLVETPVNIGGIKLVSVDSLLGKSVLNKNNEDKFRVERKDLGIRKGKIINIG